MAIGIIGIILAFVLLLFLTMKNWSTIIVSIFSVVVVALFNGLNLTESIPERYVCLVEDTSKQPGLAARLLIKYLNTHSDIGSSRENGALS